MLRSAKIYKKDEINSWWKVVLCIVCRNVYKQRKDSMEKNNKYEKIAQSFGVL